MEGKKFIVTFILGIIYSFLFFNLAKAENVLDVPFITQFPPGTDWYHTKNCGPTSYLMIDSFYTDKKLNIQSIKDVDDWLNKNYGRPIDNYNGYYTNINDLKILGLEFGNFLDNDVEMVNSLEKIKNALKNDLPVIIFVYTNMYKYGRNIDVGHFMVITGITDDTVYTNDPGKTEGKNKAYPLSQFIYAWSLQNNAALIFYPPGHEKILENKSGGLFLDLFNFANNIFDIKNILPDENGKDVKGETEVSIQPENNNFVYTASITDKNQSLEVEPGQIINVVVKAKNTGNTTWQKNLISLNVLGTKVDNQKFFVDTWKTHLRPTLVDSDVASGETGIFSFQLKILNEIGNYNFRTMIVRQDGLQFTQVGSDIFSLNLNVKEKKVEEVLLPIIKEENEINIFDQVKNTVDNVINKVNEVVTDIVKSIPTFFGGGSSNGSTNNTNSDNDFVSSEIPEPELFFTASASSTLTNIVTTTIFGEKSTELVNLKINNLENIFSSSGKSWSSDVDLVEGENNLLFSFSNFDQTKIVTGTLPIILDSISPDKPILNSILNTDNSPQLNLSWQSADVGSGLAYYILENKIATSTEWQTLLKNTTSTILNFPVAIGNSYEFRVKAVDLAGNESSWSNEGNDDSILVDYSKEVIINEIAYAPTYQGACGGEWIELYNPENLDLFGWSLEVLSVNSSSTVIISASSTDKYLVIGSLNIPDTGAKIVLKNNVGKIIDETDQSLGWFVTPNFSHARSFERINTSSSGNLASNWRENNSLRFQLFNSMCNQDYSSRGFDNNSYYFLSNNLAQDYIFSTTSTSDKILILSKEHNPYILDSRVILPAGYTLVLEPGVVVVGVNNDSLLEVAGTLQINGTASEPVYFTSARDKTVSDWYLSGNPSRLEAAEVSLGDWGLIIVKPGGTMQAYYTNFFYGGHTYRTGSCFSCWTEEVIRNEGGSVVVNNSNFDNIFVIQNDYNSSNDAYIWNGGNLEVNNSNFNNGYRAILSNKDTHVSISNNKFSNFSFDGVSPVNVQDAILDKWENNVFENNKINNISLPTLNISEDYTLTTDYNDVYFNGINVSSGAIMMIMPGVNINLNENTWLKVEGSLQAVGTENNHISICPNQPKCSGLWFSNSQNNILSYVDIRNGGYHSNHTYPYLYLNYYSSLWLVNSQLAINNSSIMDSRRPSGFGICGVNSDLDISNSEFGWSVDYPPPKYSNWIDGGIKINGGSLHLDNDTFRMMNYAVDASQGGEVTSENMSSTNFIDMYDVKYSLPNNIFSF
ncbi:MAG: C39 family peptidase [Patescibacteria group bacterium]|nr:C39 family peptidase [Patescibacteria group bacterium]